MIRARVISATIIALVLFAWQDAMLWGHLIERDGMQYLAGEYHDGWRVMRDALVIVGGILLAPRWVEVAFYTATLFLFSVNGFVDVLYCWLDGRAIPSGFVWECDAWHLCALPGPLNGPALVVGVVMFAAAWASLWMMIILSLARIEKRRASMIRACH